jgi:hypothetical protein
MVAVRIGSATKNMMSETRRRHTLRQGIRKNNADSGHLERYHPADTHSDHMQIAPEHSASAHCSLFGVSD